MSNCKKVLILLSGGQDSTTCLFWAIREFGKDNVWAIGFDYGQRHKLELECAAEICKNLGIDFKVFDLPLISELTKNSLTDLSIAVDTVKPQDAPPNSLVDGRNLLFISYSAIYAKQHGINNIVVGVSEADSSGYPDCRLDFIKSLNHTLNLGFDYKFNLLTPLMNLAKAQVWGLADDLGVTDIIKQKTLTCYNGIIGDGCMDCPACKLRRKGELEYV